MTLFNKYFYIYMKAFASSNVTYWTLFSYTIDKYYISINKLLKYQKVHFLKYLNLIYFDKEVYINNLIKFKRNNSAFKTGEDFKKYLVTQLYRYTPNHMINFIGTDISDELISDEDDDDEEINHYIHSNPFDFKIKNLISQNRKLVTGLWGFKIKRQCRITKFLVNLIKLKVNKSFNQIDFTLAHILSLSKFGFNIKYVFEFLKKGFVYVNGQKNIKPMFVLNSGDRIQLLMSIPFYNYYFYQFNSYLKITLKYHNKFFKNEESNFNSVLGKQEAELLIIISSFKQGIPRYLEVDFLTLSIFVLYKPTDIMFINSYTHYIYNFYLSRLYN